MNNIVFGQSTCFYCKRKMLLASLVEHLKICHHGPNAEKNENLWQSSITPEIIQDLINLSSEWKKKHEDK